MKINIAKKQENAPRKKLKEVSKMELQFYKKILNYEKL